MGASSFYTKAAGETAREAFNKARDEARYYHGHGGYTGTIAEKDSFVTIAAPAGKNADDYAFELVRNSDSRVDDKWGPAGCINLGNGEFLFFGWASE